MTGPWVDDVELFICCRCGALVAWVDQPGGPDKDAMTEHNVFHGLSRNRARVDTKGYRYLGEIQTRVRDGPSGGPLVSVSEADFECDCGESPCVGPSKKEGGEGHA